MMDIEKAVAKYSKNFQTVLVKGNLPDIKKHLAAYRTKLSEMYASENFRKHNIYPTTNTPYIYAVIAMCLELKGFGLTDKEIIDTINNGFSGRRNFFKALMRCINILPNSYQIAKKWNISDHEKRVKDGSLTYDYFRVSDWTIEYRISKCMYVEMFQTFGIRSLCKIFCMTDTASYENLTKHVIFIRHSDLSDGNCCHDEVIDKGK
jgi:hypothetical protein